jgi:putative iron-regulated protein
MFGAALLSCRKDEDSETENKTDEAALKRDIVNTYSEIVYASYEDSYKKAVNLQDKIKAFVASPSAAGLEEAKKAWLESRVPYLQTEAYRFYGGPIDDEDGPEGLLNAWPMDEVYIDYVEGDAEAGIINAPSQYPVINKELIESLNEEGGETNISTGYHAIEFLLWGQDLNGAGPGNRPYTDYVTGSGGTAANQTRRGEYLLVVTDLLVENLQQLVNEWKPGSNNFRKDFNNAPADSAIAKIILGMGSLSGGELAGERMQVALNTKNQEDEHSCFSDNTHNDIVYDAKSIDNVFFGRYTRTDGTVIDGKGINDLAALKNSGLNDQMVQNLAASELAVKAIKAPFDNEISDAAGRLRVAAAIESLQSQADKLVEVAAAVGIRLSL